MKYDLSKIMKADHTIKRYMKLYSLTYGVSTWSDSGHASYDINDYKTK